MAKFEKGKSGNPNGRPKGSRNEKTEYIRDFITQLIGQNASRLLDKFNKLPLREQYKTMIALLPYTIPKQTEARFRGQIDLSLLTDEQIDQVIEEITTNFDDDD